MNDIKFGVRMLAREPAFTLVAAITLALGIGANTAIFTLFNAILLQSLPVREPARLVLFSEGAGEGTSTGNPPPGRWPLFSMESYDFLRRQPLPFESLAAVRSGESPVAARFAGASQAERAQAHLVSGNYFTTMGVDAALGRTLTPDDDRPGASPAAVLNYGFWSDRLHADPSVVGRVATVNGTAFTIVGITPREFYGERVRRPPDFWIPLVFQPQIELRPSYWNRPDAYWLALIGRLPAGETRARAQMATTLALQQFLTSKEGAALDDEGRRRIQESRVELVSGAAGISGLRLRYSEPLQVLLAVVALVLLIACANVGNLLLARAAAREGEITVRLALGATRGRLMRQLLTESLLLAALGAAGGVLLARWVVSALAAVIVAKGSPVHATTLDARVLAFTIGIACLAGIAFGLMPALTAGRTDLAGALKSRGGAAASRAGRRYTRMLVVAQIAISLVLLVGANLFARTLLNLERQPLGFDREHVLLTRINPRLAGYTPASVAVMYRRLFDRVSALPGVTSATIARYSPLSGTRSSNSGVVEGYTPGPKENVEFETLHVGPSYAATLGIPVIHGRDIGVQDAAGATLAGLVNEAFVRKYFPNQNPLGRHFGVNGSPAEANIEIVGVLKNAWFRDSKEEIKPIVFPALLQDRTQFALDGEIALRTAGDPTAAAAGLRRVATEIDPNLPVNDPRTLSEQVASNFDSERLAARLVGLFGALALLLASVGLYGVITQGVVQRTGEIGLRMALGAQRQAVLWMILRDVLVLLGVGLAVGTASALGAARLVAHQLYGLQPAAPAPFAVAIAILVVVAVGTGWLPARRAARVDPMHALRRE